MPAQPDVNSERMNIVIVGHVDHGKSTIIGRLLADTNSLPQGKLQQVKETCLRNSKTFEYAFLIDALKDEQAQGITIDSARIFLRTKKRHYLIIDAPGHIEFLKNMITGASHAEAVLLVIDAKEGIKENSRRHGYMVSMLGIKQIVVLVNKMDLVGYSQEIFEKIKIEYKDFMNNLGVGVSNFIPVCGSDGDNIVNFSKKIPWYSGITVIESLDSFKMALPDTNKPFRMPVQDVYKFTDNADTRRIIAGSIETGKIRVDDEIVFYPSGRKTFVKSIEKLNGNPKEEVTAGHAVGFTVKDQLYVSRGQVVGKAKEPKLQSGVCFKASIFWLANDPMVLNKDYIFKIGTLSTTVRIEKIDKLIDSSDLSILGYKSEINKCNVAECIIQLNDTLSFDIENDIASLNRFVIVDNYLISGGGIIKEKLEDKLSEQRDKVAIRNYKWETSSISIEERIARYDQKPALIVITGQKDTGKKAIARELERRLFEAGKKVYFLGIGNLLYGVDADIKSKKDVRDEHIRRLGEVANILLDAGIIVIVTAIELTHSDLESLKLALNYDNTKVIWVGDEATTDINFDLKIDIIKQDRQVVDHVEHFLRENNIFSLL